MAHIDSARRVILVVTTASLVVACSGLRHPLDDSETRPDTEALAVAEAGAALDQIGEALMEERLFTEDTWTAGDGCETAPFAPSQGDVGQVLIRTYEGGLEDADADRLLEEYEEYWVAEGESVSMSSANMEPGAVARVRGIGYELVLQPQELELRAFIPCY